MSTHRTHAAWTVQKLLHTKQISLHLGVVTGKICKSSAHDAEIENGCHFVSASLMHEFKPTEFHAACQCEDNMFFFCEKVPLRGKTIVAATERFRKNRHVKRAKLSLQHIPLHVLRATFARVCVRP